MKTAYLAILFLIFSLKEVTAQRTRIDSLVSLINLGTDSSKVLNRIRVSELYRNYSNDTSQIYAVEALDMAVKNNYPHGQALAHNALGFNYYVGARYGEAIKEFELYQKISQELHDHQNAGSAINNIGNVQIELGHYSKALGYYIEALAERKKAGNKIFIAQSYNNIGYLYKEIGDYDKAIENILTSLRLFDELQDENGIAYCNTFLGVIYSLKKDFTLALTYHSNALAIEKRINDLSAQGISLQSIASLYADQKRFDDALGYYTKASAIYKNIGDRRQIASIQESIGLMNYQQHDYSSALHLFQEAIRMNLQIGNLRGLGANFINLGNTYLKEKNYSMARINFDSAMHYSTQTGKKEDLKNLYKSMSELFDSIGDYKSAFVYYQSYASIKDSLFNIENSKSIAGMQTKYETEKKERQIEEQKFEISRKNYWITGILILLVLSTLLASSYYRRYKLKQERKLQIAILKQQDMATKSIIEAEENERKRIAGDLHDGVGQLMSAAKMNLSSFESRSHFKTEKDKLDFEKIMALVDESCREVRNVSHNMMPNALLKRGLSSAVKEFIDKIDYHVLKVNLYSEGLNERLDSNVETVLYRIIQECVNNVIKHSGANQLDISLIKDESGIAATVEDNGKGFDPGKQQLSSGIGLKNIVARVEYLKGTVDFDSSPGKGTLVAIHVPV